VRAIVHNPTNADRLIHLTVEVKYADLDSPMQMESHVRQCDAVVHCSIGTDYGNRSENFTVS
jgi:hypothetical protein